MELYGELNVSLRSTIEVENIDHSTGPFLCSYHIATHSFPAILRITCFWFACGRGQCRLTHVGEAQATNSICLLVSPLLVKHSIRRAHNLSVAIVSLLLRIQLKSNLRDSMLNSTANAKGHASTELNAQVVNYFSISFIVTYVQVPMGLVIIRDSGLPPHV